MSARVEEASAPGKRRRPTLRHRVEYLTVRALFAFVGVLPERMAYAMAGAAGRLFFRLAGRRRALALRFLRQALGPDPSDAELLRLGRIATGNIFKVGLDSVRLIPLAQQGRLFERIDMGDTRAQLPPPPMIVVSAHLGCWEGGAMAFAALHGEVHAVAKAARNPLVDQWLVENRHRAGLFVHPRRGGIKTLARRLARGGVAAMIVDQNQRLRPVIAPFFGAPARCERSAAKLALRLGCPVVVAAMVRVGPAMRFKFSVREPIHLERTGDPAQDLVAGITRINRDIEAAILAAPDQYLWIHDRYRGAGGS
ncbi:MAG: lysophospholipid acyltransferase family protein [Phycisphaerales bacterium]|nr:lysophospholipid acyltransferase family protein [Phycisphaerales bacterium]